MKLAWRTRRSVLVLGLVAALVVSAAGATVGLAGPAGAQTASCTAYWAQAGAFRSIDNANRMVTEARRLAGGQLSVVVLVVPVAGLPLYRVAVGPLTKAESDAVVAALTAGGIVPSLSARTTGCPTATTNAPAPAPVPKPTVPTPTTAAGGSSFTGGYRIQVAAFRSQANANRLITDLKAALGKGISLGELSVVTVTVAGAPLYRVQSLQHPKAVAEALLNRIRSTPQGAGAALVFAG